jgi:hypothetical protein
MPWSKSIKEHRVVSVGCGSQRQYTNSRTSKRFPCCFLLHTLGTKSLPGGPVVYAGRFEHTLNKPHGITPIYHFRQPFRPYLAVGGCPSSGRSSRATASCNNNSPSPSSPRRSPSLNHPVRHLHKSMVLHHHPSSSLSPSSSRYLPSRPRMGLYRQFTRRRAWNVMGNH